MKNNGRNTVKTRPATRNTQQDMAEIHILVPETMAVGIILTME